ncbi:MAG TPA: hypothetical protein VKV79_03280, partial [Terriglobia bacterium]|nr:hypothetical protein [Terriglobia bacterium]
PAAQRRYGAIKLIAAAVGITCRGDKTERLPDYAGHANRAQAKLDVTRAAGVIYALVLAASASRHRLTSERVKLCNLYWQYVCILWLFILPFVYLSFGRV